MKALGGDGIVTPTERTAEQTVTGIFWAYDGTPSLCAPPRLYNQITMQIADQMDTDVVELARLLALVNMAMADAGIAVWESKYYYEFWRPVTGIREADENPALLRPGDGNPATVADLTFTPLGAPASNLTGPNFTPPFPAYPSGHAGFGGALFQVLRRFYERDHIAFTFVSDEFNGVTLDHDGNVRPLIPRQFSSLSEAEEENGQSRIYLGIHWSFDKSEGIAQGDAWPTTFLTTHSCRCAEERLSTTAREEEDLRHPRYRQHRLSNKLKDRSLLAAHPCRSVLGRQVQFEVERKRRLVEAADDLARQRAAGLDVSRHLLDLEVLGRLDHPLDARQRRLGVVGVEVDRFDGGRGGRLLAAARAEHDDRHRALLAALRAIGVGRQSGSSPLPAA